MQENVAAGSGPIEIFNEIAYRFDHVRAIVLEYLLDRIGTLIFAQGVVFIRPIRLALVRNNRSMVA